MKQVGSIQVSVVAFVVLLACQNKGECSATRYSALNNTTIPTPTTEMISEKFTQTPQRQIRESYRQPEIPVFGKEDHESRISVHNFRNHMRDDDMSRHNRPVMKGIKKSSSTVSIKSSISIKSSSKKSSKRDGEFSVASEIPRVGCILIFALALSFCRLHVDYSTLRFSNSIAFDCSTDDIHRTHRAAIYDDTYYYCTFHTTNFQQNSFSKSNSYRHYGCANCRPYLSD